MSKPLVSIIIPSYNHARFIEEAIQSVQKQTYPNIELIVVDDGSRDESHEVLKNYLNIEGIRLILNSENRGQSAVVNQALAISRGEFVSFLPSDDWYLPKKTELQVQKFNVLPDDYGIVYGRGARYDQKSGDVKSVETQMLRGNVLKELVQGENFIYPITPMFKRECIYEGLFDERFKALGEAIYNIIAITHKVDFVDEVVGVMRNHDFNVGKDPDLRIYRDAVVFWEEFFSRDDLPSEVRSMKQQKMCFIHLTKGLSRIVYHRDYAKGRQLLRRALKSKPSVLMNRRFLKGFMLALAPRSLSDWILDRRYKQPSSPSDQSNIG